MNIEDRLKDLEITQKEMKRQMNMIYILVYRIAEKQGVKIK